MSQIGSHIKELGPLLSKNADVIAALQAGFIGSYGEWHTSANLLEGAHEQMAVLSGLLHILPSSQIQVRKPQFKQDYIKFNRNSSADAARIGHHIDCFGSGETHGGTFPEEESAKWIAFIGKEYPNTAVGGETCNPGGLKSAGERSPEQIMTCEDAKEQMRELRWSYLNVSGDGSDGGVINSWRSAGCYKEMLGNMGYRLELEDASWNADLRAAGVMNLNFSIANRGYAALFSERFVYAVLKNGSKTYKAKLPLDARTLLPGQGASRMSFTLRIPRRIEPGQYALALWLPDRSPSLEKDPRFAVALSNEGIWESETGLNILDPAVQIGKYEGDQRASTQSNFIENR
jgi:hypothetical protein